MSGSYDPWLIGLSVLVAIFVSYTALNLAGRVASAHGLAARCWLVGGGAAMGTGIWSMHFIGMLAFSLPIAVSYHVPTMLLSLAIAIGISTFALGIAGRDQIGWQRLSLSAVIMGCGVAAMHYSGMYAMQIVPMITYEPGLFTLSIVIAIAASFAALWLAFNLRQGRASTLTMVLARLGAAVAMGLAISGMHYTGMAASQFAPGAYCIGTVNGSNSSLGSSWLALIAAVSVVALLAITVVTMVHDAQLESKVKGHAERLEQANARLQHLALHDPLTGLANRRLLEDSITGAIERAHGLQHGFTLLQINLDGFKSINDSLGHQAGDELLREVTYRLTAQTRRSDTLARLEGDEFVALLEQMSNPREIEFMVGRMLDDIGRPIALRGLEVHMTACIGVCVHPGDGSDVDTLLRRVEAAAHHAKQAGRNTFKFFSKDMLAFAHHRLELESGLRRALINNEFELHFQPKAEVLDDRVRSVEALVRWRHPERGMIRPDEFIPLAEETGIIVELGEWVLREACRRARQWQLAGLTPLRVAVNLSARQFRQNQLAERVEAALREADLPAQYLELELTESAVMYDPEASAQILRQLSRLGIQLSIDDFGTGYSSLSHLKRFPLDKLKIDRGFIRDVTRSAEDASIVRAVISLAHTLKLKVIAEGVETREQLEFLREAGCDQYQGYYFSPPLAPEELTAWMEARQLELPPLTEADVLKTHSRLSLRALKFG